MASTLGKLLVGGGTIVISYRLSNTLIESVSKRNKYSEKSVKERLKRKPKKLSLNRDALWDQAKEDKYDALI